MIFVNKTGNSVCLDEIGKTIPFLGTNEQSITADEVKKSSLFQRLCVAKHIEIVGDCIDRIENNLLLMQQGFKIDPEVEPVEVSIKGQFFSNTGYSKANRNFAFGLLRAGCVVGIDPINKEAHDLNEIEYQQISLMCKPPTDNAIVINSAIPSFAEPVFARYSILYTTIEACSIPQQFVDVCEPYHEIWTTSDFCKEVLESSGLSTPVRVVPNSVNVGLYSPKAVPHTFRPNLKEFVFLSVFGWNYRKGYDALLKSYLKAFTGDDNVSLLIVTKYEPDNSGECQIEKELKAFIKEHGGSNPPHIARCGRSIPEFEMPRLYRACNCFVLPSRGEGFGLPYMEASLCGLPIISTNHGGQTMFLKENNSFLVNIDSISPMPAGGTNVHYWDGQMFPQLTSSKFIDDLALAMKDVYTNYESALVKNCLLQSAIIEKYTPQHIGKQAKSILDDIVSSL